LPNFFKSRSNVSLSFFENSSPAGVASPFIAAGDADDVKR
jgi:hypothetical protein